MSSPSASLRYWASYATEQFGFADREVTAIMSGIRHRGDRMMIFFLSGHGVLALALAAFFDTWLLTIAVSTLAIAMFLFSAWLLPGQFLTRCISGVALQTFVALHIYQMHGLPEMHFFFFTGFTMMLVYQDWLCMWPGALLIIGQHILFAILHNAGAPLYFFPETYVGFTKLFFHFGIAISHVGICGCWAMLKKRQTLQFARQEADLREAKERAESATRAKSSFLAMMSHEIRTPMNAVLGMTQLLLSSPLNRNQREFAQAAHSGAEGLLTVINDVLDFSRIEARKVQITVGRFRLNPLLGEVCQLLRNTAEQKGLALRLDVDSSAAGAFLGDANRIRQIVLNLTANAIKYTDKGSVVIQALWENLAQSGGTGSVLQISVIDTGHGIHQDLLPDLFKEFSQVHGTDVRRGRQGGSGLGLAICKRLLELMDGEIGVGSVLGEGSTFWFRLPLQAVEEHAPSNDPGAMMSLAESDGAVWPASNARVLVAEDNAVNRKVAEAFLTRMGCQVEIACDGVEVVRMWLRGGYDIVFMDCQMPEADGYTATKSIRAHETKSGRPRTPIIAMTAYAMEGDREACLAAGMDD